MRNIKLTLAYDGTDFCGWQIQPGQPTIQGHISETLEQITQQPVTLHGAGRTDAGVHAWGQVANFQSDSRLTPEDFARALNALLPPAIRVRHSEEVAADFHARWRAQSKIYVYRIYRASVVSPFVARYVLHDPYPLDFDAMSEAAQAFVGEHDFASFAASSGSDEIDEERITKRRIFASAILQCGHEADIGQKGEFSTTLEGEPPFLIPGPNEWVYVVKGRSFLRHMVRKIIGTLIEVGRGRLQPSDVPRILAARDRTCSGPTVAPQGLCLLSVEYANPPASSDSL